MDQDLLVLAEQAGIYIAGAEGFQLPGVARSTRLAMDAQPSLVTQSNAGIPSYLTVYVDPKLIEVLVSPMKAAVVVGNEVKKGDWLMDTAVFPVVESTGETSSYGDYSENGRAGVNTNFPQRQSYHYQVITNWGERELERAGLAKIDWANRTNIASVLTLNKFQNLTYFFGVAGLQNYGLLNAPALPASIDPINQAGAILWADKDALQVYEDIQALFAQLQTQANGLVDLETKMTLAMSPVSQVSLTKATSFNVNVMTLLKTNFPNMRIETAPEYATASGNLVQLFPDDLEGQRTVDVAFTEKLRAHPVKVELSSFKQKKSQGTWGAIIYRPILIASMIGI
jgi:hypothetical protein